MHEIEAKDASRRLFGEILDPQILVLPIFSVWLVETETDRTCILANSLVDTMFAVSTGLCLHCTSLLVCAMIHGHLSTSQPSFSFLTLGLTKLFLDSEFVVGVKDNQHYMRLI